jgi:hypothetical protein
VQRLSLVIIGLAAIFLLDGCKEGETPESVLSARQVQGPHDLIGGPLAHGEIGDFVIENDKVRFIITGAHHSWGPGLFGGTIVDADIQRTRDNIFSTAQGNDHFAEMFPSANLVVAEPTDTEVRVLSDGTDGEIAQIEAAGRGVFYLEGLSILDPRSPNPNSQFLGLLSDVQARFNFRTTYTLRPGTSYLEITTEVTRTPDGVASGCTNDPPFDEPCDLTCEVYKTEPKTGCLKCECDSGRELDLFTESVPLLARILGDVLAPTGSNEPLNAGMVGGDFLFFGGGTNIFAPGLGFDEKGAIFDNLFRGIDTISSPLPFDWIGGVGDNVSYAVFTKRTRVPETCKSRIVLTSADPKKREQLEKALIDSGLSEAYVTLQVDALIRQGKSFGVQFGLETETDIDSAVAAYSDTLDGLAEVGVEPDGDCRPAKLLIPLFTSSATMVVSGSLSCLQSDEDDDDCDVHRRYSYTRYLTVAEGDIASAAAQVFAAQGAPVGQVRGIVYNSEVGRAEKRADIYALRDPDPGTTFTTYDAVVAANRAAVGTPGVMLHARADVGTDPKRTGHYEMQLPEGSWYIVARTKDGVVSAPERVVVTSGGTSIVNPVVVSASQIQYRIRTAGGSLTPAKLTIQALNDKGEPLHADGKRRVALGPSRMDAGIFEVIYSPTGEGTKTLEPGRYRITASRGFEFSIDEKEVDLKSGQTDALNFNIRREVDTTGFISGDFHLHAGPSVDSGMSLMLRVLTSIVEGVELISSSDHDAITDYRPYLLELGLENEATTQVGLEVSTLEMGHTLGFPLKYDYNNFPVKGAIDWVCKTVFEIWDELRALGEFGPENTVVVVAHPRDGFLGYYDQFRVDPWSLERLAGGLEEYNPLFKAASCDFDAMEILNAKRFELIRTPTTIELNEATRCLQELELTVLPEEVRAACSWLRTPSGCSDEETVWRGNPCLWYRELDQGISSCLDSDSIDDCKDKARNAVTFFSIRRMLRRTPDEQNAWVNATKKQRDPDDAQCKPETLFRFLSCEKCLRDKRDCAEANTGLSTDEQVDCDDTFTNCPALTDATGDDVIDCQAYRDYAYNEDQTANPHIAPCSQHHGVLDDWFSMLNHGLVVTAMGNSDSHGTTLEPGIPRNYIASTTDNPSAIDRKAISAAIKAHQVSPTTGPFLKVSMDGRSMGETVNWPADRKLGLKLSVQTASWFSVTRIEVYRNAELIAVRDVNSAVSDIVDFDEEIELERPDVDSWYVVLAMGLDAKGSMSPVYVPMQLGELGLDKITTLAFANLGAVAAVLDSEQLLPDYFPSIPFALSNPIFVDINGDGYQAPLGRPPFCPTGCTISKNDDGEYEQNECTDKAEVCLPIEQVGLTAAPDKADGSAGQGICGRPIPGQCGLDLAKQRSALRLSRSDQGSTTPWFAPTQEEPQVRVLRGRIGSYIWNAFRHGWHCHGHTDKEHAEH